MKLETNEIYFHNTDEQKAFITWKIEEESYVNIVSKLESDNFNLGYDIIEDGIDGIFTLYIQPKELKDIEETIAVELAVPDGYPQRFEIKAYISTVSTLSVEQTVEAEPKVGPNQPIPIWKDTTFRYTTTGSVPFSITTATEDAQIITIYEGTAYPIPQLEEIQINVNKIIANYLETHNNVDGYLTKNKFANPFTLMLFGGRLQANYKFYGSYTYDNREMLLPNINSASDPINMNIYKGQHFCGTLWNNGTATKCNMLTWMDKNYNQSNIGAYMGIDFKPYGAWSISFPTSYPPADNITMLNFGAGKQIYNFIQCHNYRYFILYKCPKGGFCSYAVTGKVNLRNNVESYTTLNSYDNTKPQFGKRTYQTEAHTIYQCNLVNVPRNEAEKIPDIINSTEIYIEDIVENKIVPVICTTTDWEYQLNKKIKNYQLEFITSQEQIRR